MDSRVIAVGMVASIYLLTVLVLWLLSLMGPVSATVEGVINQHGATVWFAAAGIVAAFILIAVIGLVAVYQLAR